MHWLGWIRFFEAAARHQNFARAADELHLTHGAISRQIRQLEAELGVSLFERRNRAVFLTEAGRTLQSAATQSMDLLAAAVERIRKPRERRAGVVMRANHRHALADSSAGTVFRAASRYPIASDGCWRRDRLCA
jgi:DNA-binding transcriptional LysR family regulator